MIETEIRGVLDSKEYDMLISIFEKHGTFKKEFIRLNLMYGAFNPDSEIDFRCRVSEDEAELVLKKGKPSSADRKETEFKFNRDSFMSMALFLSELGYDECIAALRKSVRYMYKGIEFTLVKPIRIDGKQIDDKNCVYYEAELMAQEEGVEKAKHDIMNVIKSLDIKVLEDHREEAIRFGGENMVSSHSFDRLVKDLNEQFDIHIHVNTDSGMALISKALELIPKAQAIS